MITSEHTKEIAEALSKAQAVMEGADKSSTNPFFHSKYAELSEVWNACRKPLTDNGLSFIQSIHSDNGYHFMASSPTKDNPNRQALFIWLSVTSRLQHISEQFYEDTISMPVEADPQSIGKVTTYLRRYGQMALCGIAPTDDDGESAVGRGQTSKPLDTKSNPKTFTNADKPKTEALHTLDDMAKLTKLMKTYGHNAESVKAICKKLGYPEDSKQLSTEQINNLCKEIAPKGE
jgi:hypothetical protein